MTVRYLAQELYHWTQKVEELTRTLAAHKEGMPLEERTRLELELLQAKKEQERFRAMLEAKKEKPLL